MNSQWPVRTRAEPVMTQEAERRWPYKRTDTARLALAKPSLAAVLKTKRVFVILGGQSEVIGGVMPTRIVGVSLPLVERLLNLGSTAAQRQPVPKLGKVTMPIRLTTRKRSRAT
jgi:hypothetical protein